MKAGTVRKARVDHGGGIVQPAPTRRGKPHGNVAHMGGVDQIYVYALQPVAPVNPDVVGRVHEDVGDTGHRCCSLERSPPHLSRHDSSMSTAGATASWETVECEQQPTDHVLWTDNGSAAATESLRRSPVIVRHRGNVPTIDESAFVAPSAVVCGDVRIGPGARILHGAVLTAEDGEIRIGAETVVMEQAVIKGRAGHPAHIGDSVLIGPHAHVNGSTVSNECFIATGASLFPGSSIGRGAEVRINAIVHVNSVVPAGAVVPIGWVAVGDPASILSPDRHDEIWEIQQTLDFTGTVYGVRSTVTMREIMSRQSAFYGAHMDDELDP